jgi:small subunit ribosomal protein S20
MANNKSARKRIETNERNRLQNRYYKTSVRTLTKLFLKTLDDQTPESKEKLQTILNSIYSFLDKGTKKRISFIRIRQPAKKQDLLVAFLLLAKL